MEWLFNQYKSDEEFQQSYPLSPFSDEVILYLNELSSILLRMPEVRHYPDVVTFAFFCRKANLLHLQKEHATNSLRLGRGLVFHIAPSNVPVNFAYSLICGLLSGNNNIVRLPGKQFRQVDLIVGAIRTLSDDERFDTVSRMVHLIKYERGGIETTTYSALADVRLFGEVMKLFVPSVNHHFLREVMISHLLTVILFVCSTQYLYLKSLL